MSAEILPGIALCTDGQAVLIFRGYVAGFASQKEFAASVGASEQYVSDVVNRRREIPAAWAARCGLERRWIWKAK